MKRNRAAPRTNAKKPCQSENDSKGGKDPLQVYCRVRPMQSAHEVSCMRVIPPNVLQLTAPEVNRNGVYRETQYVFKQVFDETTCQEEVFDCTSLGLVQNLVEGKNGLLFTYGITGSGKSYTMNGVPDDGGIMPRCLDVLFNSIHDFQAKKYVFKPDRLNGFDVQPELDAMLERQKELMSHIKMPKLKKKDSDPDLEKRQASSTKVENVVDDNSYAVFITFVEIYNNCVYDLMEDYFAEDNLRLRPLQPKLVREDGARNMYVHGVNEIEVKSSEEAFEVFYKGQKRRRLAHTALNTESSRSHSVFTIRLVQAPLDMHGERILEDRKKMNISQLSLVDLAGSERTTRTKTYGQRLREAGNINNSLMTLRTCLEILRENQLSGTNKIVPYRESRVTHLFKNYFDGEGDVRMIICVNPRTEDYDETVHVLKFSEMSQEVQVNRPKPVTLDTGLTPGRRKANQIFKNAVAKLAEEGVNEAKNVQVNINAVYRACPRFPTDELTKPENELLIAQIVTCIQMRKENSIVADIKRKGESLREQLELMEKEMRERTKEGVNSQDEIRRLNDALEHQKRKNAELERRVMDSDAQKNDLKMKCLNAEQSLRMRENELENRSRQLTREQSEIAWEKSRLKNQLAQKTDKIAKEMQEKLQRQQSQIELERWQKDRQLRKVKKILDGGAGSCPVLPPTATATPRSQARAPAPPAPASASSKSSTDTDSQTTLGYPLSSRRYPFVTRSATKTATMTPGSKSTENVLDLATPSNNENRRGRPGPAVSNPRYRRSRSAGGGGGDVWLDHRPLKPVPLNTILQPVMKKRKSITKLTDIKDITNKASKYCLMTQAQDSDGDLETCLYKGDVVPTAGGGAQVMFSDVEILHQRSPNPSPPRKRTGENASTPRNTVEDRCAVSLEGHSKRSRH